MPAPHTLGTCGISLSPIRARGRQKTQEEERASRRHKRPQAGVRAHGAGGSIREVAPKPLACCDRFPFVPEYTSLVTGRPLLVPGTGDARKSGVGGARPPWPPPPRRSQRTRGQPSVAPALYKLCSPLSARPDVLCNPGGESSPAPTLLLPRLGREGASSASQPGVSSPSPPGGVATPYRVLFPSVGWVPIFTLM